MSHKVKENIFCNYEAINIITTRNCLNAFGHSAQTK